MEGRRRTVNRALRLAAVVVCVAVVLGSVSPAGATNFPTGFSDDVVASGLTEPTAISFFPDGRMAIAQKSGVVRLVKNGALQPTPLIDIEDRVNDYWDRGLIGIAVDPSFASNPYVYLLYVYENDPNDYTGTNTSRLTRVTVTNDTANPASEQVLLGTVVANLSTPTLMACAFRSTAEHRHNDPTKPAPRAPGGASTKKSSGSPTQGLVSGYAPHGCGRPGRGR